MSLADGKTSKSPSIPLAGGTANISALVKSMRKQGQLEPPPIPWATDDVNEFVATSSEDVTTSVGGEEDDHRDITPRDSVRPTSVTPMPARIRMSPSPSVPPPSGLAPDWIRDWKDDGQKDNMEKVQTLWNKYANSRKKQHENRAQSTVSRKPLAKRLGPRGRVSKEQGGVQFIAKEWIAERKSEI
ncbi:hypothetical protein QCA50_006959 [Cerrena zonata]|uniref:Uncharacterized protein n=1 Tax=Cerrena zonata TaxID=2478898 RepID=A0AAW0GF79_9APHY